MSTYENISMNDYFNEDGHYFIKRISMEYYLKEKWGMNHCVST